MFFPRSPLLPFGVPRDLRRLLVFLEGWLGLAGDRAAVPDTGQVIEAGLPTRTPFA
ncbi:MAG TPA: hypothetical protein VE646_05885 [Actinomycetota bacterium]|nr:hypothetical protein [Actinomycetota bacterium]